MSQTVKAAVIDYDCGNLFSIKHALKHIGVEFYVTDQIDQIDRATHVILPGVGSFPYAMKSLESKGLIAPIQRAIHSGRPFLGICLGMQLMFEKSSEFGVTPGLGIIPGEVIRLEEKIIPHVGWSRVSGVNPFEQDEYFYFVHSYQVKPRDPGDVLAYAQLPSGKKVVAAVKHKNSVAFQFHPEKSGEIGISLLKNFLVNF